jgi:TatD DNase family protein
MYDTHTHLNFQAFANDYDQIVQKSLKQGMFLNIVGSQFATSRRAIEIAREFERDPVYAAVGLHPSHIDSNNNVHAWDYEEYKKIASGKKVVAIGETGLDYHQLDLPSNILCASIQPAARSTRNIRRQITKQKQVFLEHIKLALELKKPVIIHCRPSKDSFDAYLDIIKILKQKCPNIKYQISNIKAVVHCFLADWKIAKQFLDLGLYLSFTGIITYKNVDARLIEVIKNIPPNRIMIETDAPYLTPEPYRGKGRNEPLYVKFVAQRIAEIKGIGVKEVIDMTMKNGITLFDTHKRV